MLPSRRRLLAAGLLAPLLAGRPAGLRAQAEDRLLLSGSSTVAPLVLEIAKRFESLNPGVRIEVQTGGSSRGLSDARQGRVAFGMVSRALKPEEAALLAYPLARDGIGLIVHRSNPVAALSAAQVQAIYTGQVRDWAAVGGPVRPISVVHKAEGRSTQELFLQHFGLVNSAVKPQVVIGDNAQGLKTVAGNPGAIGYVSIGSAEFEAGLGTPIRLLPMDGVPATVAEVQRGRFPISRPLNLVSAQAPTGLAARFLAYARSPAVHDLVREQFFVPL
ncbi:phosphate ABC transporter substrate-binding protein [Aquariibacter albus]|uniref:Phosphate ABC transporter substrate-binding protein n=1 Tax=Aquariibacter albus TaxID=2759899 RepID=A0A839HGZ5_9BURK|nr:phosphate ABC transporter substrate-binding protein [Aquariibacter albus]MBB1161637.1 phosphate ABC transporter substrate-binding protein [Aquariibacter albus]